MTRFIFGLISLIPLVLVAQQRSKLDVTTFVVVGEGLAAGMANYGLSRDVQEKAFVALMARQMQTAFPLPLIQGPGLSGIFGLPEPAVRIPTYPQTTVRVFPVNPDKKAGEADRPTLFVFNLSLPNWRLADSVSRRPSWPLIQPADPKQTAVNLILGFPSLILRNDVPLWTQVEYSKAMSPTFAIVELGYFEALEAAASGRPELVPDVQTFAAIYADIVKGLRDLSAEVVVTTIPDPVGTGYFTSIPRAEKMLQTSLAAAGLQPDDLITRPGLYALGNQALAGFITTVPSELILRVAVASEIRSRVRALNAEIGNIASQNGAVVYDLEAFFRRVRENGTAAGDCRVTADYLGGFYSLDGVYPSITGHALIANDFLLFLNRAYGESFPLLDLVPFLDKDPALFHRIPE